MRLWLSSSKKGCRLHTCAAVKFDSPVTVTLLRMPSVGSEAKTPRSLYLAPCSQTAVVSCWGLACRLWFSTSARRAAHLNHIDCLKSKEGECGHVCVSGRRCSEWVVVVLQRVSG